MRWGRRGMWVVVGLLAASWAGVGPDATAVPAQICHPVAGSSSVVETFGAPRSGGRTHAGNDVFAAKHTPVVATVDGWIDYVKTDNGGLSGRAIGLIGVDGWKYRYIHLDNDNPGTDDGRAPVERGILPGLAPGRWVLAGQVIGWVGDSGNAETTPPHLHFEIRTPAGTPVTPYPHLRNAARCAVPRAVDVAARPGGGAWVLTDTGRVAAIDGAPTYGGPNWGWNIGRGIAAMPDGAGYVVLDGWGGIHRYGSAAALGTSTPYHQGQDTSRSIDVAPNGADYVVVREDGTVDSTGPLALVAPLGAAPGAGARSVEITDDGLGWLVVDAAGGLRGTGLALVGDLLLGSIATSPAGARGLALTPLAGGAWVLDGDGTIRTAGRAGAPIALPWGAAWAGLDANAGNRVAVRSDGLTVSW